jgi:hypothetical protein
VFPPDYSSDLMFDARITKPKHGTVRFTGANFSSITFVVARRAVK